jgi:type I restriction enzyme S subunit
VGDDALAEIFSMSVPALVSQFDLLAGAPGGVARLRELILSLAVRGKLTAQHPTDEPAHVLLQRIQDAKALHVRRGGRRAAGTAVGVNESDLEVLDSLPPGWVWSSLSSIGLISPRNEAEGAATASFVPMSAIPVAFTDAHETESRPWRDIKSGFTHFAEGDVGVAKITPCFENGKSAVFKNLCNGVGAGTTELYVVRPLCGVMPRYVLLFLKSPGFLKGGEAVMTGTAGQKRLPRAYFEDCPFPLPPLAEQARIVARVDELMQLCDALEAKGRLEAQQHARLLETLLGTLTDSTTPGELAANWQRVAEHFDLLLDRPEAVDVLEQTVLQLAVRGRLVVQRAQEEPAGVWLERLMRTRANPAGTRSAATCPADLDQVPFPLPISWAWSSLSELGLITGGATPPKGVASNWSGDIPWVSPKDMKVPIIEDAQDHVSRSALKGSLSLIKPGSLLMVVRGMILAHSFPVAVTRVPVTINQDMKALTPLDSSVLPYLSVVCMGMKSEILAMVERSTHGTCKLESAKIFSLPIPVPPLGEQARIVSRVTELRRLCAGLRQRLATSQATQSRLAEALVDAATA